MAKTTIGNKTVGDEAPCYIIAEAGSNHNKDLGLAKELIDAASEAGCDAVKFQLFKGERHYSKYTPSFSSLKMSAVELLKTLELPYEWLPTLKEHAGKRGITFFSSVTDALDVDELLKIDTPAIKMASFELVDLELIAYCAKSGKPIILSTGLANLEEIQDAYLTCKTNSSTPPIILQCASAYPSPPSIMNLRSMNTMRAAFHDAIIGLSDHTMGTHIAVAGVAMGAKVVEKHFTLNQKMQGPDHAFAIELHELTQMVAHIRDTEAALGNGEKTGPSPLEMENYQKARRSVHALIDIKKGETITRDKLIVKRPGYGIKPKFLALLEGREAKCDIKADSWIEWSMV